jgi:hypothetical protein
MTEEERAAPPIDPAGTAELGDAFDRAVLTGIQVVLVLGRRHGRFRVWCPGCDGALILPTVPWAPSRTARRLDTFVSRHLEHDATMGGTW